MTQARITIPYFSGHGHTAQLAQAIAAGAGGARLVDVERLTPEDWQALNASDAIVFGSPTYMGSTAARFDEFLEEASGGWLDHSWTDKIAAGFTVGSNRSGDKLSALMRLSIYAAQMGMIWVGQADLGETVEPSGQGLNRDGSWLGLMATSDPDKTRLITEGDTATARRFGQRIKATADRWTR